jgi:hypothetical protein
MTVTFPSKKTIIKKPFQRASYLEERKFINLFTKAINLIKRDWRFQSIKKIYNSFIDYLGCSLILHISREIALRRVG